MRGAPDYCPHCGAAVLRARAAGSLAADGTDVVLNPQPSEMGTVWIDQRNVAHASAVFYIDGQPRYRPHTCPWGRPV